ncbi:MAG TPA: S53 family peptidase, partial [Tepidisphaeraceae bacterium]|nr:S53 family peptidase [Tepidisphaeraceae bacterium]
ADSNNGLAGYSPADITNAYGIDSLPQGATRGSGQTIAIVDAYNDPNIIADLGVFDQKFDIAAPPSFEIVNQTGGTTLPTTNDEWAGEIALDVEWAHAIAPGANILLVEANSASTSDLMTGVTYATDASGVSVVSLSWGGSEFLGTASGENEGQAAYDPDFLTPAGHQGVTVVVSAGDAGPGPVQWPAASPDVVSVGGTSLTLTVSPDDTVDVSAPASPYLAPDSDYTTESSWSGTNGGFSTVETQPSWQSTAVTNANRAVPDVSWEADPNTGVSVYDSVPDGGGGTGWAEVGGTSVGAPSWAGLMAVIDQQRVSNGLSTLDGSTGTLPLLYELYAPPNTVGYSTYTSYFNDVIDPTGGTAVAGYDTITGLGTPKAVALVHELAQLTPPTHGGGGGGGGGSTGGGSTGTGTGSGSGLTGLGGLGHLPVTHGGGSTSSGGSGSSGNNGPPPEVLPPVLPSVSLTGQFITALPSQITSGKAVKLELQLTNAGSLHFSGPIDVDLTTVGANNNSITLANVKISHVAVNASATKVVKFHFKVPASFASGTYTVDATVVARKDDTTLLGPIVAGTTTIFGINSDLASAFASGQTLAVEPGQAQAASLVLTSDGTAPSGGIFSTSQYALTDSTLDSSVDWLLTE